MTLDQLEMIEAIIMEGSFQAAAKRLNKSQPSLSVGVKKVEELYGIEIFSRQAYRPELTQAGQLFYREMQYTLSSYRNLDKLGKELGMGKEAQIRIVLDPLISSFRLKPILESAAEIIGKVPIYFQDKILDEPVESLKNEECDFAFGNLKDQNEPDIEFKEFCHIELVPMISKKLLEGSKVTKDLLDKYANIEVQVNDSGSRSSEIKSGRKWFVSNHALKEDLIVEGLGWGRLSKARVESSANKSSLIKIPAKLIPSINLAIHFMRNRRHPLGPIAKSIWESVGGQ